MKIGYMTVRIEPWRFSPGDPTRSKMDQIDVIVEDAHGRKAELIKVIPADDLTSFFDLVWEEIARVIKAEMKAIEQQEQEKGKSDGSANV